MRQIYDYLYALSRDYLSFPLIIQICIGFIICSIFISIYFTLSTLVIRRRYTQRVYVENNLFPKIDNLIFKHINPDRNNPITPTEIRNEFSSSLGKLTNKKLDFVVERLQSYKILYRIDDNEDMQQLMNALDLDKYLSQKLQSASTVKEKIRRIKELSIIALSAHESDLLPFTFNSNKKVQAEARIAYIKLSKNEPFKFFDDKKETLTEWNQISLLNHLKLMPKSSIPNFSKWVSYSENESIISFCLKMCAVFKQVESIPAIITFLDTISHELRATAIQTLGELKAAESEPLLKKLYHYQPDICQIEILKALGRFNTGNALDLLNYEFNFGLSVELRKNAAVAILEYRKNRSGANAKPRFMQNEDETPIRKKVDIEAEFMVEQ